MYEMPPPEVASEIYRLLITSGWAPSNVSGSTALVSWVAKGLPSRGYLAERTAWKLIEAAVAYRESEGVASRQGHRPLVAARHLLGIASYPEDALRDTEKSVEEILKKNSSNGKPIPLPDPKRFSTVRRKIAASAGNYGDPVLLTASRGKYLREIANAVVAEMNGIYKTDAFETVMVEGIKEMVPPQLSRRRRRKFRTVGVIVLVCIAVLLSTFVWPGQVRFAKAHAPKLVDVSAVDQVSPYQDQMFWVPADAPIESLPSTNSGYCGIPSSEASDERRLDSWLKQYGSAQYDSKKLTVRDVSGLPGDIGISDVVASGTFSSPRTPGFIFYCESGEGGGIQWIDLSLKINGSEGVVTNSEQPIDYFWLNLHDGEAEGLEIDLDDAGRDFRGIVTAKVSSPTGTSQTITLPFGAGKGSKLVWHGIPDNKLLLVVPFHSGTSTTDFSCSDPAHPYPASFPCTRQTIEKLLTQLWGSKEVP